MILILWGRQHGGGSISAEVLFLTDQTNAYENREKF